MAAFQPLPLHNKNKMHCLTRHFPGITHVLLLCGALACAPVLAAPAASSPRPAASASANANAIAIDDKRLQQAGVEFQEVQPSAQVTQVLRLPGTVIFPASGLQLISAPAAGVVREVTVQALQQVSAGTVVIRLYSPQVLEWQREYLQAQSKLALANDKLQRDQALFDEGIIARSRLEESRSNRLQAQAALEEARQVLLLAGMSRAAVARLKNAEALSAQLDLAAKSSGSIAEQLVNVGQRVEAGAPLLRLARGGDLLVELQAGRAEAERIAPGDSVRVPGCDKPGRVVATGAQVNLANQAVAVRASIPGSSTCLRPNQHVEAELTLAASGGARSVPAAALVRQQGRDYVFLRAAGGAQAVEVKVLGRQGERVVLQADLPAGARVAVKGTAVLKGIWAGLGREGS